MKLKKRTKLIAGLIIPGLALLIAIAMPRPHRPDVAWVSENLPPAVFYTSLADTISPAFVTTVGCENVTGIKFSSTRGEVAYFSYSADADRVLSALKALPFPIDSLIADAGVRPLSREHLQYLRTSLPRAEVIQSSFFWNISDRFEAYEIVKGNAHHAVVVDRINGTVTHRVARG